MNKTLICIDMANLHYHLNRNGWEINWKKFKDYFCKYYGDVLFIMYDGIMNEAHFNSRNPGTTEFDYYYARDQKLKFFKFLRSLGYIVEWKFTVQIDNPEGQPKRKCNFDVEITMDALLRFNDYSKFVLCSGDRDFTKLIKYLNSQKKKTLLIYPKDSISNEFRDSTSEKSFPIHHLKKIVGRPKRPPKRIFYKK